MNSPYDGHEKVKPGELRAIQVHCKQFQHKLTYPKCREDLYYKALRLTQKPTSLAVGLRTVPDFLRFFKGIIQK